VCVEVGRIVVTAAGRLLLRSIAMCFDAYAYLSAARATAGQTSFSKVV